MKKINRTALIPVAVMMILLICGVGIGWLGNDIYEYKKTEGENQEIERLYDGLRIEYKDYFEAKDIANNYDKNGDWVCVNVKGMSYERAVEVCQHEVGHEIFAEILEKHPEKINIIMEAISNES
jgi:hypothetical protein